MKGLIYKNILCMRKNMVTLIFVIIFVTGMSTMFALSFQFGNMRTSIEESMELGVSESSAGNIGKIALLMCMLVPLAVAEAGTVFQCDSDAGFYKTAASLPLTVAKRIAAKYITDLIFLSTGLVFDIVLILILCNITDMVQIPEFMGSILSFAAVVILFDGVLNCIIYATGRTGNENFISVLVMLFGVAAGIIHFRKEFYRFLFEDNSGALSEVFNRTLDFIHHRFYIALLAAAAVFFASYLVSVAFARGKKGGVA